MRTIDVGVGHDDDFVVAQLGDIEFLMADAGAERRDKRADFSGAEHPVESRPLDVENFSTKRKDGLIGAVARLFRGTAGGISLDDEKLGQRRVFLGTIGQLAR